MAGIIEKPQRDVVRLRDLDFRHMAVFGAVGAGADRPEIIFQHRQANRRFRAEKRTPPAARPNGEIGVRASRPAPSGTTGPCADRL